MKNGKYVTVCVNFRSTPGAPSCGAQGGPEIARALEAAVAAHGLPLEVKRFHCLGMCARGPNVKLSPGGEFWHAVRPGDLGALLDRLAAFAKEP